jgi:phosphate-selective porin OprO/OprP
MSRMHHALLRAVALCALIQLAVDPALGFQGNQYFAAQHGDPDDPDQPPAGEDYISQILKRLDEQDAEIQRLKQPQALPAPAMTDDQEREARQDYGADIGPRTAISQLQSRFEEFQKGLGKKAYPTVEVHGVAQMDSGWFGQDAASVASLKSAANPTGVIDNGSDFRRTRLSANGALTENMNYFVQMDFAFPGRPTFTDVWMEVTKLPIIGNVRAGQWKMPFSLEVVSSFRYTTFPERSVLFQSFDPFRHIGFGFYNTTEDEMMTWSAAAYRPGQDQFGDALSYGNTGNYAGVGRITGLAWYENEGTRYLHLGAGYNYVAPQAAAGTNVRTSSFNTIPEYFIGQNQTTTAGTAGVSQPNTIIDGTPKFVNTKNFAVNHYNLVGWELLLVEGPLSVQSEFMILNATRANSVAADFGGFYTTVGYFLTGEHRPYLKKSGAIDRIKPFHNFIKSPAGNEGDEECCGLGAWELAVRWSYIDLNAHDIQGGRLNDLTVGLNWYLNAYAKVQFNYIRAMLDNPTFNDSVTDIFGLRAQFDF